MHLTELDRGKVKEGNCRRIRRGRKGGYFCCDDDVSLMETPTPFRLTYKRRPVISQAHAKRKRGGKGQMEKKKRRKSFQKMKLLERLQKADPSRDRWSSNCRYEKRGEKGVFGARKKNRSKIKRRTVFSSPSSSPRPISVKKFTLMEELHGRRKKIEVSGRHLSSKGDKKGRCTP